jgi:hypothetical protein
LEVALDAEIGIHRLEDDFWSRLGRDCTDDPAVLAPHLRSSNGTPAMAADRELLQAPFRAGIRLESLSALGVAQGAQAARVNLK